MQFLSYDFIDRYNVTIYTFHKTQDGNQSKNLNCRNNKRLSMEAALSTVNQQVMLGPQAGRRQRAQSGLMILWRNELDING